MVHFLPNKHKYLLLKADVKFFPLFSRVFLQMKSQVQLNKIKQMQMEGCGLSIVKGHRTLPAPSSVWRISIIS